MVGRAEEGRVCFCPSHTGLPVRWIPKESARGSPWYSLYRSSSGGWGCVAGSWRLASQVKAHSLSPGTLAAGPQHMPENAAEMVRRGPKADHTLHKTDPSLPPSPGPEADARPRPTQGSVCPGLSYPAPSSLPPSMPSTSAEGHCVLTGGASRGLGLGLGTRWEGTSRQGGTVPGTTLRLAPGNHSHPLSISVLLLANELAASFPSFPRTSPSVSSPFSTSPDTSQTCSSSQPAPAPGEPRRLAPSLAILSLAQTGWLVSTGPQRSTHSRDHSPGHNGGHGAGAGGEGMMAGAVLGVKEGGKRQSVPLLLTSHPNLRWSTASSLRASSPSGNVLVGPSPPQPSGLGVLTWASDRMLSAPSQAQAQDQRNFI